MRRGFLLAAALAAAAAFAVVGSGPATADVTLAPRVFKMSGAPGPEISGAVEFRDVEFGTGLTECPQAGSSAQPKPLDHRTADQAEQVSSAGNDRRANDPEYSCFPQNETSIDVNPRDLSNAVGGANDYRLGWATSGYYATTDNGNHWYTGLIPFPTLPNGDNLDGGRGPGDRLRQRGSRLLRRHQLQPHGRHERRVRLALHQRGVHVESAVCRAHRHISVWRHR